MGDDEQLVPDNSVYLALHQMSYNWPCLSFDVLRDNLGTERSSFPHTAWIVAGTQAGDIPGQGKAKDEIVVMRLGSLSKTQHDDDSDHEDDDDDDTEDDAQLDFLTIPHVGSVNRIRARQTGTSTSNAVPDPYHVASFSETGKVHIWDVKPLIDTLAGPSRPRSKLPLHTITNHGRNEGFAVEWGETGLLTGDVASKIFLTTLTPTGFSTAPTPYLSHTSSVEDLQWSPSESTVFASCSADRTVRVWDVRTKGRKSVVSVEAHDQDVNVISWNKGVEYLLLSGGDEGGLKVWDLRMFKE
jgi:ribosome assembly protein RRB1